MLGQLSVLDFRMVVHVQLRMLVLELVLLEKLGSCDGIGLTKVPDFSNHTSLRAV